MFFSTLELNSKLPLFCPPQVNQLGSLVHQEKNYATGWETFVAFSAS